VVDTLSRRATGGRCATAYRYKYAHGTTCTLHRQAARLSRAVWSCVLFSDALIHLPLFHMFFRIQPRTSDAVAFLQVSPILGVVLVEFANGYSYEYTNVSRRAIANLLLNPNMSLGFWVNNNCVAPKRTACLSLA